MQKKFHLRCSNRFSIPTFLKLTIKTLEQCQSNHFHAFIVNFEVGQVFLYKKHVLQITTMIQEQMKCCTVKLEMVELLMVKKFLDLTYTVV